MKLIVARHGETLMNQQRKFYGSLNVVLDKVGQQQAQLLAKKVLPLKPTLLVQTNLRRTQQTLVPLRQSLPQVPVLTLPDLAEKGFGRWEGLDANQIQAQDPDHWQRWLTAPLTYTPPSVEPFHDFETRVERGLKWLKQHAVATEVIFLVAHLGTLRVIDQLLLQDQTYFYDRQFQSACYTLYEWDAQQIPLVVRNR